MHANRYQRPICSAVPSQRQHQDGIKDAGMRNRLVLAMNRGRVRCAARPGCNAPVAVTGGERAPLFTHVEFARKLCCSFMRGFGGEMRSALLYHDLNFEILSFFMQMCLLLFF